MITSSPASETLRNGPITYAGGPVFGASFAYRTARSDSPTPSGSKWISNGPHLGVD
jgi:hypothetical protein